MKTTKQKNVTTFEEHLEKRYGKKGSSNRDDYEREFETYKIGILIQEERKKQHISQEELALKCGTNKSYISRIENNASDIRLSTLLRIIEKGLGGHIKLSVEF
jgi:HTH-type transcriptional regulator/antitoxin HipB